MGSRTAVAPVENAIIIQAELSHLRGGIDVRSEPDCTKAELVISTDDQYGPAAAAVAAADVQWRDGRLSITVVGDQGNEAGAPVTITGVVPPGCTLEAQTTSASISTDGVFEVTATSQTGRIVADNADLLRARVADADIQVGEEVFKVDARVNGSGDIRVDHARVLDARTTSGDVAVKRHTGESQVRTGSGDFTVENFETGTIRASTLTGGVSVDAGHGATGGGNIRVVSETGAVTVTTDTPETAQRLRVSASTQGSVSVPKESVATESQAVGTPGLPTRSFDGRSTDRGGLQR